MLGMGRFGSIVGSLVGGVLLTMGWGFGPIVALLALPALLAAVAVLKARTVGGGQTMADKTDLAHA
jgi:AAHS family 4-hydroxybenzoate transporter-like MFS transporter